MTDMKEKISVIRQVFSEKKGKADDLDMILEKLHEVYEMLKPVIPEDVKAIFEKYGYTE